MSSTSCIVSVCIVIETSQFVKFSLLLADVELDEQVQFATIFLVSHRIVDITAGVIHRCKFKRVTSKGQLGVRGLQKIVICVYLGLHYAVFGGRRVLNDIEYGPT